MKIRQLMLGAVVSACSLLFAEGASGVGAEGAAERGLLGAEGAGVRGLLGAEGAAVMGFWDFKSGTAGEEATECYNSAGSGTWRGAGAKAGGVTTRHMPVYDSDVPGAYVYGRANGDSGSLQLLTSHPQSLKFVNSDGGGGQFDIAGMSTALSQLDAFTVEYFVRLDRATGNDWFCTSYFDSAANGLRVSIPDGGSGSYICCYVISPSQFSQNILSGGRQTVPSFLNKWRHIALVYQRDADSAENTGTIKYYVDRVLMKSNTEPFAYDNTAWPEDSAHPLRLGNATNNRENSTAYQLHGAIACPRVTAAALQPDDFLVARDVPLEVSGGTLAFWAFKDGAAGTDASTLQNTGARAFTAVASAQDGTYANCGRAPQFSADVPGKYIFEGPERVKKNLVVEQPQSLWFYSSRATTSDPSASVGSGKVVVSELGSWLMAQTSYTVECFFKNEDASGWKWRTSLCGWWYGGYNHRLSVNAVDSGPSVECGAGPDINANNYARVWGFRDKDSDWHHVAFVRDGATGRSAVYYDYAFCGREDQGKPAWREVSFDTIYKENQEFTIGTEWESTRRALYTFRGKIACVRVSACARTPDDFLYASDKGPTDVGTLLLVK